jgi:GGDEF domain-containing protein
MMMTPNQRTIAQQQELIHKLAWDASYGCYTRAGFEHMIWPEIAHKARHIVYFDVDGVHAINEKFGSYDAFNAMIKQVVSTVRSTDIVAGRWNSGDELLVCMVESPDRKDLDPAGLVKRLTHELAKHGLTATFATQPVKSSILHENVKPAADEVLAAKKARGVGR